jgi:Protein of unknown function (DUF541)
MDKIVTTVAATGEAETTFDVATFSVHLSANDAFAPAVRVRLRSKIDDLEAAIRNLVDNYQVSIIEGSTKTTTNVNQVFNWDANNQRVGVWTGTYTMIFHTDSIDKVNRIYEVLVAVHEATVNSPSFFLKNKDALNKQALRNAWLRVSDRFADECKVIGTNPVEHEVASWEVTYEDTKRENLIVAKKAVPGLRAQFLGEDDGPVDEVAAINIEPGKAKVLVNLNVSFKKKD